MRLSKRLPNYVVALSVTLCLAVAAWPDLRENASAPAVRIAPAKAARGATKPDAPRGAARPDTAAKARGARPQPSMKLRAARMQSRGSEARRQAGRARSASQQQSVQLPDGGTLPPLAPKDPRR